MAALRVVILGILLASFASAGERPDYVLTLRSAKESVELGEMIPFEVELRKLRGKPVEVNALRLARNSVSLTLSHGDRTHRITRIYGEIRRSPDGLGREVRDYAPRKSTLKRGKPLRLELPLVAIRTGELTVTAAYAGDISGVEELRSEPVRVTVTAPPEKREIAAVMETSLGAMVFTFWPDRAYNTVLNFLMLAKTRRYDGLSFHRVRKGFLVQGGDPLGDGGGGPGWFIPAELDPAVEHVKGVISMARSTRVLDTAGSQFFIMHGAHPELDGKYAAFGKVLEGMDVLDKLAAVKTERTGEKSRPVKPPIIKTVRVIVR